MTCFVEMRNRRESFPRAGIERVSIEESPLPPQPQRSSADSIFVIERAEPALINAVEGQEGMPAAAFWMVRKPLLVQLG
jgi:hypothetical protein